MKRGSFKAMKHQNKALILSKILNDGPISRAQIAKETKLTPPTVGTLVKELIERNIVIESSQGESKGGRKPTMLVINEDAHYIIGIDAGPTRISGILADISGRIIGSVEMKLILPVRKEVYLSTLVNVTDEILRQYSEYADHIIGIGVAMHGVVDGDTGQSLYAPNLNLRQMPIAEILSRSFPYIVKVENDARALVLAEKWFGQGKKSERLVAVNIGNGVGAGLTIGGELYRGESYIAGEIGHMTIDIHGEICECGNRGCLQTLISGPAIVKRAKRGMYQGEKTLISRHENLSALDIFNAAEAGDKFAQQLFKDTGIYTGIGLTNLIHTLNPGQIILHGGLSKAGKYVLPYIKETIDQQALTESAKQTQISISELGDHATALGAGALIIVELFEQNGQIDL